MLLDELQPEQISKKAFDSLLEYSCSVPTGDRNGKVWRRNLSFGTKLEPRWVICEYVERSEKWPGGIEFRRPVFVD